MISRRLAISFLLAALAAGGCGVAVDRQASAREAAAEAAYPPTGRFVEVMGTRVHAVVQGQGPDLVLIHGASGSTRDFTFDLVEPLSRSFRVIALDRPGLGYSADLGPRGISPLVQADVLRAAADKLGVRRPIVLGHSYGGAVAMAWALRDPGGPRGLVIVSGATMPWPGRLGPWYAISSSQLGGATVVPLVAAYAPLGRAEDAVSVIFRPEAVPAGYVEHVGAGLALRRAQLRSNARQVNSLKAHLQVMAPNYGKLTLPVEVLHGTADTIVPADVHAVPLSQRLPNANLTLIEGGGHMIHHTRSEAVLAAIRRLSR